jgi:hypothetical protein
LLDSSLDSFGEYLIWELAQPVLEQGTNDIGVVEVVVGDKIDVTV